jgi:hypothetical protein
MPGMVTRGIREYVARDWQAVPAMKDAYWSERIARLGPLEALRVGDQLRRQVLQSNPSWPNATQRDADLRSHVRLSELFRRAGATRRA